MSLKDYNIMELLVELSRYELDVDAVAIQYKVVLDMQKSGYVYYPDSGNDFKWRKA